MFRQFCLVLSLAFLSACGGAKPSSEVTGEFVEILKAVLQSQPDQAKLYREFIAEYPDEKSLWGDMINHKLCVARETAGQPGDFDRISRDANEIPPSSDVYGERWEQSSARQVIPEKLLPEHLRWDSVFAFCPSGLLRLGTPEIEGDEARVFVENSCSGWCGWGGEVVLRRNDSRWEVDQVISWWQS